MGWKGVIASRSSIARLSQIASIRLRCFIQPLLDACSPNVALRPRALLPPPLLNSIRLLTRMSVIQSVGKRHNTHRLLKKNQFPHILTGGLSNHLEVIQIRTTEIHRSKLWIRVRLRPIKLHPNSTLQTCLEVNQILVVALIPSSQLYWINRVVL